MTTYTQADLDIAVRTERNRFKLVMASSEYRGRETSANHMLFNTDAGSSAIIAALAGMTASHERPQTSTSDSQGAQSDFDRGAKIAASLPKGLRK